FLDAAVAVPTIKPGPGSGVIWSIDRTLAFVPDSWSWTGSLLTNPVAASIAPCARAAPWPKSGYSTIVTSAGVRPAELSRAWSIPHDEPYLPGIPIFLPLRSAAALMPDVSLAKTIDGNRP